MKKIVVLSLVLILLCGCAGNETNNSNGDYIYDEAIIPEVGMMLKAPEKLLDSNKSFYVRVNDLSYRNGDKLLTSYTITVDNKGDNPVIYFSTYMDYIFEWDNNGEFYAYYCDTMNGMNGFAEVMFADKKEREQMEADVIAAVSRVGWKCPTSEQGYAYVKCNDADLLRFDEVYVYEQLYNNEVVSTIYVDKDTGLWAQADVDGKEEFYVTEYSESRLDINIPKYK